jgi:signal transduction histidine kinase
MRSLPEPARSFLLAALLVVLVGVSFTWLRTQLQQMIDRVVFKDSYEYRHALGELSRDLSSATNLDTLSATLPSTLRRLMNLDFALLLVHEASGVRTIGRAGAYQPAMLADLSMAANDAQTVPLVVSLGYGYLKVLLVPLRAQDAVVAHLCLGPKVNGEPFRAEDKDLLATLSGHVAGIVQNAQLVTALQIQVHELDALNDRLQHAQEAERARLSADIHDEPLQTAISLQLQLASVPGDGRALAPLIALNQLLIKQLCSVCIQMRPAALDDLGLFAALDQLIQEQSERAKLPIRLEIDPMLIDYELSPTHTTVLYRAAQEALTNSLRHARPRSIVVCLLQHEHAVQLRVTDDGCGFAVPPRFKQLVAEGHLGLTGLRERVHHNGGSLQVTSSPGQGTTVEVEFPLQRAGAA